MEIGLKHAPDVTLGKDAASSVLVHGSEPHRQPWLLQEGVGPGGGWGGSGGCQGGLSAAQHTCTQLDSRPFTTHWGAGCPSVH